MKPTTHSSPGRLRRLLTARLATDRGSFAVETAILAPVLIMVLGLMVALGRVIDAEGAVDIAARAAARAASLERDPGSAQSQAQSAAAQSLSGDGITCRSSGVSVDTGGYATAVGQDAEVTAEVTCTADLSDIALPGLPGAKELHSSWTSPLDTYRAR